MTKLTTKQETFVQAVFVGDSQREAYKKAYDVQRMTDIQIDVEACRMFDIPKIALRLQELRQEISDENGITLNRILAELEMARLMASVSEPTQSSAMILATMAKAKLMGLLPGGHNFGPRRDFDSTGSPFEDHYANLIRMNTPEEEEELGKKE